MKVSGVGHSDIGLARQNNEDAYWIDDELGSYVVCDGMGGHACGEKASALAIETVARVLGLAADTLRDARNEPGGHVRLVGLAEDAVQEACRQVHAVASSAPEYHGMGCTLTLLLVAGDKGAMAHVGDTRLYLQRDGGVDQLSSDHTVAADFVRQARLTPEAARTHRYSNALTRAVGPQASVEVETLIFDVFPDDVFLLCSDGLGQYVESLGELTAYLTGPDLGASPRALVELAIERGGGDNVTAVVVTVTASERERAERMELEGSVRRDLESLRTARLFDEIPLAHLLWLYAASEVREYAAAERFLPLGAEVRGLYCVLSGRLRLETESGDVSAMRPGDSFGGPALFVRGASVVSLTADGDCRLLLLTDDGFRDLAVKRPRVALALLSRVAQDALSEIEGTNSLGLVPARRRRAWWNLLVWARPGRRRTRS